MVGVGILSVGIITDIAFDAGVVLVSVVSVVPGDIQFVRKMGGR